MTLHSRNSVRKEAMKMEEIKKNMSSLKKFSQKVMKIGEIKKVNSFLIEMNVNYIQNIKDE